MGVFVNRFNQLIGKENKRFDDVAYYYWSVLEECVRGCDPSIPLIHLLIDLCFLLDSVYGPSSK